MNCGRLPTTERTLIAASAYAPFALPAALTLGAVGLTAAINGGYFPTDWGWPALAFLLVTMFAVFVRKRFALGRLEVSALAAVAAFALWTLLSVLWSPSATEPVLSLERTLVYVAFLPAVFLVTSRRSAAMLPAGVLAAATAVCAYALATRILPGRLETFPPPDGYQLSEPIGYWNGLGILAVMGTLVAVGVAAGSFARPARALAAGSLPILLTSLYLTFSRGSWIALAAGLAVALAVERLRLRFLGVGAASLAAAVIAVVFTTRLHALTSAGASLGAASSAGHRLAAGLAVCAAASVAVGWALTTAEQRVRLGARTRRVLAAGIAGAVMLAVIGVLVRTGGPVGLVDRASRSFRAPLPATGGDLNRRLVSLSGNGRSEYWRVAWKEVASHPFLGGGAGSYERFWHRERRTTYESRNAHNLYLETLAELGPIGLALLAAALGVPFVALLRARGRPATTAAIAAYTAFLVHAAVDWDWQILTVSLAALACAAAVLVSARAEGAAATVSGRRRTVALVLLVPLAAFAIVAEVGNSALARSVSAANREQPTLAERLARRAHRWAPWSAQPWQRLGEAQLAAGDLGGARRSFDHGVELDRTDWSLWYDLAEASTGPARAAALAQTSRLNPLSPEVAALRGGG